MYRSSSAEDVRRDAVAELLDAALPRALDAGAEASDVLTVDPHRGRKDLLVGVAPELGVQGDDGVDDQPGLVGVHTLHLIAAA